MSLILGIPERADHLPVERSTATSRRYCRLSAAVAAMVLVAFGTVGNQAQGATIPNIVLGTTGGYAVLAASTATNIGVTTLNGSLGVWPGTAVTGFPPGLIVLPGTLNQGNAAAQQAQADLTVAYNAAALLPVGGTTAADLANLTLTAGVFSGPAKSALMISGNLTFDGQGDPSSVFVLQSDSTLTTASNSIVSLINGAQACNVFWQLGSSATLGTDSHIVGTIMAMASITATHGVTIIGRALALNGAVTMDTNAISVPTCAQSPDTTTVPAVTTIVTTTMPLVTTTLPAVTTTVPAVTTTLPLVTTTLPAVTTIMPAVTTTLPLVTTTLPLVTTTLPLVTTTLPLVTTTLPLVTTTIPAVTTIMPAVTTTIPAVTTIMPAVTTTVPAVTTTVPVVTTTMPAVTTTAPLVTTTMPAVTTTLPLVTTIMPLVTTTVPLVTTVPAVTTTVPAVTTTVPAVTTTLPAVTTTLPAVTSTSTETTNTTSSTTKVPDATSTSTSTTTSAPIVAVLLSGTTTSTAAQAPAGTVVPTASTTTKERVSVLAEVVSAPAFSDADITAPASVVDGVDLPYTGAPISEMVLMSFLVICLGAAVTGLSRRRN